MDRFTLSHLADHDLVAALKSLRARERRTLADLLAHIAEVEVRRLDLPAAYPSMLDWLTRELEFSYDAALRRLRAARTARRFHAVFAAVAEGALDLTAVLLLTPELTPENANELLAAAAKKTKSEIQQLLARRARPTCAKPQLPLAPNPPAAHTTQVAPAPRSPIDSPESARPMEPLFADLDTPEQAPPPEPRQWVSLPKSTMAKIARLLELTGHTLPARTSAAAIDRAVGALIEQIEKRKLGRTRPPTRPARPATNARTIPAHVRRAVSERDRDQCAFVSADGRRCECRGNLEFDHVVPLSRGGATTVENVRLCCRAHNQYEAERVLGERFMRGKRAWARTRRASATAMPPMAPAGATP